MAFTFAHSAPFWRRRGGGGGGVKTNDPLHKSIRYPFVEPSKLQMKLGTKAPKAKRTNLCQRDCIGDRSRKGASRFHSAGAWTLA